ncbi:MAG: hypothetical protein HYV40_05560 [Candidatus Levybacteria bacterium]|nr:hypothetical protein [Candidatus Levybacteria bacterium]
MRELGVPGARAVFERVKHPLRGRGQSNGHNDAAQGTVPVSVLVDAGTNGVATDVPASTGFTSASRASSQVIELLPSNGALPQVEPEVRFEPEVVHEVSVEPAKEEALAYPKPPAIKEQAQTGGTGETPSQPASTQPTQRVQGRRSRDEKTFFDDVQAYVREKGLYPVQRFPDLWQEQEDGSLQKQRRLVTDQKQLGGEKQVFQNPYGNIAGWNELDMVFFPGKKLEKKQTGEVKWTIVSKVVEGKGEEQRTRTHYWYPKEDPEPYPVTQTEAKGASWIIPYPNPKTIDLKTWAKKAAETTKKEVSPELPQPSQVSADEPAGDWADYIARMYGEEVNSVGPVAIAGGDDSKKEEAFTKRAKPEPSSVQAAPVRQGPAIVSRRSTLWNDDADEESPTGKAPEPVTMPAEEGAKPGPRAFIRRLGGPDDQDTWGSIASSDLGGNAASVKRGDNEKGTEEQEKPWEYHMTREEREAAFETLRHLDAVELRALSSQQELNSSTRALFYQLLRAKKAESGSTKERDAYAVALTMYHQVWDSRIRDALSAHKAYQDRADRKTNAPLAQAEDSVGYQPSPAELGLAQAGKPSASASVVPPSAKVEESGGYVPSSAELGGFVSRDSAEVVEAVDSSDSLVPVKDEKEEPAAIGAQAKEAPDLVGLAIQEFLDNLKKMREEPSFDELGAWETFISDNPEVIDRIFKPEIRKQVPFDIAWDGRGDEDRIILIERRGADKTARRNGSSEPEDGEGKNGADHDGAESGDGYHIVWRDPTIIDAFKDSTTARLHRRPQHGLQTLLEKLGTHTRREVPRATIASEPTTGQGAFEGLIVKHFPPKDEAVSSPTPKTPERRSKEEIQAIRANLEQTYIKIHARAWEKLADQLRAAGFDSRTLEAIRRCRKPENLVSGKEHFVTEEMQASLPDETFERLRDYLESQRHIPIANDGSYKSLEKRKTLPLPEPGPRKLVTRHLPLSRIIRDELAEEKTILTQKEGELTAEERKWFEDISQLLLYTKKAKDLLPKDLMEEILEQLKLADMLRQEEWFPGRVRPHPEEDSRRRVEDREEVVFPE